MKVELSAEAQVQVREIDAWWRKNRQGAPDLFATELDHGLTLLGATPDIGVKYSVPIVFAMAVTFSVTPASKLLVELSFDILG